VLGEVSRGVYCSLLASSLPLLSEFGSTLPSMVSESARRLKLCLRRIVRLLLFLCESAPELPVIIIFTCSHHVESQVPPLMKADLLVLFEFLLYVSLCVVTTLVGPDPMVLDNQGQPTTMAH
jgi:hypothetical protein